MANAAWLALAVMAHNLARAVGRPAGPGTKTPFVRRVAGQRLKAEGLACRPG
jgi:hypothetical protein